MCFYFNGISFLVRKLFLENREYGICYKSEVSEKFVIFFFYFVVFYLFFRNDWILFCYLVIKEMRSVIGLGNIIERLVLNLCFDKSVVVRYNGICF